MVRSERHFWVTVNYVHHNPGLSRLRREMARLAVVECRGVLGVCGTRGGGANLARVPNLGLWKEVGYLLTVRSPAFRRKFCIRGFFAITRYKLPPEGRTTNNVGRF
jgi:hypothetical protein